VAARASATDAATASCVRFRPCIDIHKVRVRCSFALACLRSPSLLCSLDPRPFFLPHATPIPTTTNNLSLSHTKQQGKVKQIVGSTLKDLPMTPASSAPAAPAATANAADEPRTNFVSSEPSSYYAELYRRDNLTGGHVIMLGADDASRVAARAALGAWPGGMQLGGGVTAANAREWLDAGASHVIVTSSVFREGELDEGLLAKLVRAVGKSRLVLDLSCRRRPQGGGVASGAGGAAASGGNGGGASDENENDDPYYVVTDRWQRFSSLAVTPKSLERLAQSCDEFLVHGVDVEGMQLGIDERLVALLGEHSPLPVTYAGGARTLEDLELVARAGKGRVDVTVGSALDVFGGKLHYEEVVAWHRAQQKQGERR
jgi:phosphoribosylformimino-5-aminoimidazole carboxamide ribotide isomerase